MSDGRTRQASALRKAAARKAKISREAAEKGMLAVRQSGQPVTFAAVARAAGVSTGYLRSQRDLAAAIILLRENTSLRDALEPVCQTHAVELVEIFTGSRDLLPSDAQKLSNLARDLEAIIEAVRWKLKQSIEAS